MRSFTSRFAHASITSCLILCLSLQGSAQESAYTGPIIDMHVHAYAKPNPMYGQEFIHPLTGKKYRTAEDSEAHKKWVFEKFREHRIVKAVVNYNADWYEEDPDRILLGRGSGSPDDLKAEIEAGELHVMAEMAQYYGGAQADDPALDPYFELAESTGTPVGYHIFPGGPPGGMYMGFPGVRAANADPMQIERVLVAHPKLKIYIMHAGWPYLDDMKALMYAHPQLYVDIGVISWGLPRAEFHSFLKGLIEAGFGKRIMYGTDQMVFLGTFDQAIENVNSASFLSLQQKEDIFFNNAARFMGWTQEEIMQLKSSAGK